MERVRTLGDFENAFQQAMYESGLIYDSTDLIFDKYYSTFIKSGARTKKQREAPVKRKTDSQYVLYLCLTAGMGLCQTQKQGRLDDFFHMK